jgi:hypothetical protein
MSMTVLLTICLAQTNSADQEISKGFFSEPRFYHKI